MFNHVRLSSLAVTLGASLLAASAVPQLRAGDEFENKTTITFNAPVEISGRALPAGTYVFETLQDDSRIVAVMNGDQSRLVMLLNTIPIETPVIPDRPRVEFSQGAVNGPEILRAWFNPGESVGWEFPQAKRSAVPAE